MKQHHVDAGNPWRIGLIAMVALFVAATAASLFIAGRKVSKVVDTEYYSHGLHYAETHGRMGNAGTPWTMTASVVGNQLQVLVHDEAGSPVTGGRVVYELDRHADNRSVARFYLSEASPGIYRTRRPAAAKGELHGTMRITKGETTVIGKVVVIN